MKPKIFLAIMLPVVMLFSSFSWEQKVINNPISAIEWENAEHNFGKLLRNKPVKVEFTFKNPSMVPLIISKVESSCGCTVPDYSREPIRPGGIGKIVITFDAKDEGYFRKVATIHSNALQSPSMIYITGIVVNSL